MSNAILQVRVDSAMKDNADAVFAAMGLRTTDAIRMFLQQTINDEALPFRPRARKLNKSTLQSFKEVEDGDYTDSTLEGFKQTLEFDDENNTTSK